MAMAAEPAAQQECTLGQVSLCFGLVLCRVVGLVGTSVTNKGAANKRRQMDSEFIVDGECM